MSFVLSGDQKSAVLSRRYTAEASCTAGPGRFSPRRSIGLRLLAGAVLVGLLTSSARGGTNDPEVTPFRVGFTRIMFSDVNENDGKAAIKVWGETVAKELDVPVTLDALILDGVDELAQALSRKQLDAVAITVIEYDLLRGDTPFHPLFATYINGQTTEQYVLLVRRDGPVKSLADLRGRRIAFGLNNRDCLAPIWLDVLLVQQGHLPAAAFAGGIVRETKLSKVVLPVFFGQVDACVVRRSSFETMSELNPQIGGQLAVIAASTEMVPGLLAFRADYDAQFKDQLITGLSSLQNTPVGGQVLTIFHGERLEVQPSSCLDSALKLLAVYKRLCGRTSGANTVVTEESGRLGEIGGAAK